MTDLRTAAQQALEALEGKRYTACGWRSDCDKAITALRAALAEPTPFEDVVTHGSAWSKDGKRIDPMSVYAEPVQEPVALNDGRLWQYPDGSIGIGSAPPQRKPMTEEEIYSLFRTVASPVMFARAIERAHGIDGAPEERNFCPRCGKRTNGIHTCTPPGDCDVHG